LGGDQEVGWVVVWEVLSKVQKLLYVSLYMMMQLCWSSVLSVYSQDVPSDFKDMAQVCII